MESWQVRLVQMDARGVYPGIYLPGHVLRISCA
jgi:hypothetical protein